jgi:phage tail sheath gpL-like
MALTSIVDTSIKTPRAFFQVTLGAGARSPAGGAMKILLTGNLLATGTSAVATLQAIYSPGDAKTLFGAGSELHLMAKAVFAAYPLADVSAIAIAEAGTAATKTITYTVGPASAAGTVEVWVLGEKISVAVAITDTITTIAAAVAAAINAKTDWPVTALAAIGVVTLTAKQLGVRGNGISVRSKLTGGTTVAHTPTTGYMTAGATLDVPTTALDAIAPRRWHLIVSPHDTATELALYKTHIETQAEPLQGRRGRVVSGFGGTLANGVTLADTINSERVQIAWLEDPDDTPAMLAAGLAGTLAKECSANRAKNTDGAIVRGLKSQYDDADIPTATEINSALNNGLTVLDGSSGDVKIVRSITSYHLDAATNDDFSVIDTHQVEVPDFLADDIEGNWYAVYAGFNLAPDTDEGPQPQVATPKTIRSFVQGRLKAHEGKLIINVDALLDQLIVEIDGTVNTRANAEIPCYPIPHFHQLAANVSQVG